MKTPSISHLEAVYGHGLAIMSSKLCLKRKLTLRIVPIQEAGSQHFHFDRRSGVFTMSEDVCRGSMEIPVYHLARLALIESQQEGHHADSSNVIDYGSQSPEAPHVIDCAVVVAHLERYEQDLIIRSAAYAKYPVATHVCADDDGEGEVCTETEAKAILHDDDDAVWPCTIFLPSGAGRGSVMYQWRDGSEFMIRIESTLTTDDDGKHQFTDLEYRKIRRAV